MRTVIQRVTQASVTIENQVCASIGAGLVILLGIGNEDTGEDTEWLCRKIIGLRIFGDSQGLMNESIQDMDGEILVVSQFTLMASTRKGNRPSFIQAARPEVAIPLYEQFINALSHKLNKAIATGEFGADMQVSLNNDGPVTIWIDSKTKE